MDMNAAYSVYVRKYGKIASGTKLTDVDYGEDNDDGFVRYDIEGQTAVAMAAQDVKLGVPMRGLAEFSADLKRKLGH
jgi:hypothetical protein